MFTRKFLTTIGVITAILSLIGGIWAFDSHYATDERVTELKVETRENVEKVEIQFAGALLNQQQKSDVKFYQFMYDKLTQEKNEIRRQMRRYPEDIDLKRDYQEVMDERKRIKQQMDDALRKIN